MTFDPTKPVQTRDGRKARIICTDLNNPAFRIVAVIDHPGGEYVETYYSNGYKWESSQ